MSARVESILSAVPQGADVLDVGPVQHDPEKEANDDWVHKHLYDVAENVVGIDIDEDGVAVLSERGYNIEVADAESFDLGESFDVIVAGELIEHLANPGRFLDRCAHHLRPGGCLILTTPNPWAFCWIRRAAVGQINPNPEHTCWFGPKVLVELLDRSGLEMVRWETTPPVSFGVSWVLDRLGLKLLGGTHILVEARLDSDAFTCGGVE